MHLWPRPFANLSVRIVAIALAIPFFMAIVHGAVKQRATEAAPSRAEAFTLYWNRALRERSRRDFTDALADFTAAIQEMPDNPAAYKARAEVEKEIGDFSGAIQDQANTDYAALGLPVTPIPASDLNACPISMAPQPYRAYPGCGAQHRDIATLHLIKLHVEFVDGKAFFNIPQHGRATKDAYIENNTSFELLPGVHEFLFLPPRFQPTGRQNFLKGEPVFVHKPLEAGKTYAAIARVEITGAKDIESQNVKQWWVDVAEEYDTPAAYVQLSDARIKEGDSAGALTALEFALALFPKDPNRKAIERLVNNLRSQLDKAQLRSVAVASGGSDLPQPKNQIVVPTETPSCGLTQIRPTPGETAPVIGAKPSQQNQTLNDVLARSTRYVESYETDLGSLIGEEIYVQNATWLSPYGRLVPTEGNKSQRTESDFAILKVGKEWVGLRQVHCVDGAPVKPKSDDFRKLFADSLQNSSAPDRLSAAVLTTLDDISRESASYNIGDFQRTINVPTFTLRILRPGNLQRFQFKKESETTVSGTRTWVVSFRETKGPTMIHDDDNRDEFSTGMLWIEPATGRILKTELDLNQGRPFPFHSQTIVSYAPDSRLGMLVPAKMSERYQTTYGHTLDCEADYSNFRKFHVEAHFTFGPPHDRF